MFYSNRFGLARPRASSGIGLFRGEGAVYFERSKHSAKINRACQEDSRLIRNAGADGFNRRRRV
jgi:hypothetical protein